MSSRLTSTLSSLCMTCSMIFCAKIKNAFKAHEQVFLLIFAKMFDDYTQLLGLSIKFEGIILHGDINFFEIVES